MTNPKFETLYCAVCGTPVGLQSGQGAVVGLRCNDPVCAIQSVPSPQDPRNAVISALLLDKVPAVVIAVAFETSRQRVYQIATAWRRGA